ncbi:MAG: CxxC-x17-CxxC domain-containing protein [Candidatus Paceibacterota bacterium]
MGDFRPGGGKRFGGRDGNRPDFFNKGQGGFGGRDRGSITMHQTTCAKCGNPCEVPFRPIEGRPLYCNNCFQGKKAEGDDRGGDRFPKRSFNEHKFFSRPDFRSNSDNENNNGIKKQLEMINSKMDRLVRVLESMAGIKEEKNEVAAAEESREAIVPAFGVKARKNKIKISKKSKKK